MPLKKTYLVRGKGGMRKTEKSSKLYTLVVYVVGGPVGGEFAGQTISRTIQIRGDQTLKHLHRAIFKAFNRSEEHLYEFDLGEEGPDGTPKIYSMPMNSIFPGLDDRELAGDVAKTTIDSLGLEVDREFSYTFDMGDNWEHLIVVTGIEEPAIDGRYPKVVARSGRSPPQYPDEE
ncbi:MAG TPA: plasmid pRiA4b ORF-3 family protein [Methanotrichaceae archaeon]|nr:plasmid pRiA4b ORF-3 family protein [Methanotrichaceae archaeon]